MGSAREFIEIGRLAGRWDAGEQLQEVRSQISHVAVPLTRRGSGSERSSRPAKQRYAHEMAFTSPFAAVSTVEQA